MLIDTLKEWKQSGPISASACRKITRENAMKLLSISEKRHSSKKLTPL